MMSTCVIKHNINHLRQKSFVLKYFLLLCAVWTGIFSWSFLHCLNKLVQKYWQPTVFSRVVQFQFASSCILVPSEQNEKKKKEWFDG